MDQNKPQRKPLRLILVAIPVLLFCLFLQGSSNPNSNRNDPLLTQSPPTSPSMVTIRGTVTDTDGQPLHTYISISSGKYEPLGNIMSDRAGKYTIKVPSRIAYIINAQEADGRVTFGPDIIPTGYMDQDQLVMTDSKIDLAVDFKLQPAGAIWLETYDLNGNYLYRQDVNNNNWRVGIYPLGEPPTSRPLQYINHQANTFWGWQNGSEKNLTVLLIPPEKPVELWIDYDVSGVGGTYIHLDNDGKGYFIKKGEVLRVNFLFDAAKTEYRYYAQRINKYLSDGYAFSNDITGWNDEAERIIEGMTQDCEARNFTKCISTANTVLTRTIRAREDAVFQAAQQDIEKYRKQEVKLQITNCDGSPVKGVSVVYVQQSHDFIFGVGWPENGQLPALKKAGFNGAIEEAWWGEVISDDRSYDYHDERFEPVTQQGMDIVMHTGVWITPITNPDWYFVPRMIFNMTPAEIANLARDFSAKVTEHYGDQMSIYDIYNEPQNAFFTGHFTLDDIVNIAAASAEGASRGAPDVPTYINFYYAYLGGDMSWVPNPYHQNYPPPEEIIKAILQKDIPFDNIGLEFYNDPSIDFGIYNDTIEHYSHFGKSVLISELSYNGSWRDGNTSNVLVDPATLPLSNNGSWQNGNTDQIPAEWAKYAYTIAFSKPYATGVVWIPGNGPDSPGHLFQSNGNPGPIIDTVGQLIHSWTTTGDGITDEQGELSWRGFIGNYEIQWNSPDGSKEVAHVQISQNTDHHIILGPSSCNLASTSIPTNVATKASIVNSKGQMNPFIIIGMGIVAGIILLFIVILLRRKRSHKQEV
jgi:hypothetical protein